MITLEEIKKLRQCTGAGIKNCKEALVEAKGDLDEAVSILRKKGQKIASKRSSNPTQEGRTFASISHDKSFGVIVAIGCETDFVAKSTPFKALGRSIVNTALAHRPKDSSALCALTLEKGVPLKEEIVQLAGIVGENVTLVAYTSLTAKRIATYVHNGSKLASIVGFDQTMDEHPEVAEDMAIQVAVSDPLALTKKDLDPALVAKERALAAIQVASAGKPSSIVERIIEGKMEKFYQESVLLMQPFYQGGKSVSEYLQQVGPTISITNYKRISI